MPYIPIATVTARDGQPAADERWAAVLERRPDLGPAVELQKRLLARVFALHETLASTRLPRLSLPPKYLALKLTRGVPALAGEPIPLPITVLARTLLLLCDELAEGGAGDVARHIRDAIERGELDAGSLLSASLSRDQGAIRTGATHRGLAPDLVWLVAELAVAPYARTLLQALLERPSQTPVSGGTENVIASRLDDWTHGYCPSCGSWPAMAEVVDGHRALRCSLCAAAWELPSYACVYCGEGGQPFVTAAPDEERKDRRLELCSTCGSYLKTVDLHELSPFPLLSIGDLETMDLDVAAMEHGYTRPALKDFGRGRAVHS
jgi:FdhE protein